MSCEKIQPLLSKYADNEATPAEREAVRLHVLDCAMCVRTLNEYEEVSAIFASAPTRPPEPQLRVGLFREINLIKEAERRKQRSAAEKPERWYKPSSALRTIGRGGLSKLWGVASPFAVLTLAVLVFAGVALLYSKHAPQESDLRKETAEPVLVPVPTNAAPIAMTGSQSEGQLGPDGSGIPMPPPTKAADATFLPVSGSSATAPPTVINEAILLLAHPTPVFEKADAAGKPSHLLKDPVFGYSMYYPANWWTQVDGNIRYFRPWTTDASRSLPYWIELRIVDNASGYSPDTYNRTELAGRGTPVLAAQGDVSRLRYTFSDPDNSYDALYTFDTQHIYTLRLVVPRGDRQRAYTKRWTDGEAIFSGMTGRARFSQDQASPGRGDPAPVLFLNGSDLWMARMNGQSQAVSPGVHAVRQFALAADSRTVAFIGAKESLDLWPRYLYVADLEDATPAGSRLLWTSALEIHDIAWYSDRVVIAIAKTASGLGVYRITVPQKGERFDAATMTLRITQLGDNLAGAKSLAISPDRQLITFLAPIGDSAGTDIYAVRPDGSDLRVLMSHSVAVSPSDSGSRVLLPQDQAIKSYVWVGGHLEPEGYRFNLIFTCGNSYSPTFIQGGFLYSTAGAARGTLLDRGTLDSLGVSDPTKMQIIHLAYSTNGRLAMTGYYNDREGRADKLAGLWTADIADGMIVNIEAQPIPTPPNGITDLQWAPDNMGLIYRETIPQDPTSLSARYDGRSPFTIIKLDLNNASRTVLYNGSLH